MFSSRAVLSMRIMVNLMSSVRRRETAINQAYLLDFKLCQELLRLVRASEVRAASVQYTRGLDVLILWDIKRLYEMSATRSTHCAQRCSARLAHLARDEFALAQQSPSTRARVESEFRAYRDHGIDPEDLYVDDFADEEDDVTTGSAGGTGYDADDDDEYAHTDDVFVESEWSATSDDVDHRETHSDRSGKLQCFVEWDYLNRAE